MLGHMPFTAHVPSIPARAQRLGNRHHIASQLAAIPRQLVISGHQSDPGLMLVHPGKQGSPGRATAGGVVELGEAQAVIGERIEVGRHDFSSVATHVGIPHVVRKDHNDVGLRLGPKGSHGK